MNGEPQQADDFHVGDTVRNRNTGAQMPVRPAPSGTWVPRYYELVSCPHEAEAVTQPGRHEPRRLLGDALAAGQPLPAEVREALNRLLDGLSISEDRLYNPDTERSTECWQAAAWRAVVDSYRRMLGVVREHGVMAGPDPRVVESVTQLAAAGQYVSARKLAHDNSRMTHEEVRAYVDRLAREGAAT